MFQLPEENPETVVIADLPRVSAIERELMPSMLSLVQSYVRSGLPKVIWVRIRKYVKLS